MLVTGTIALNGDGTVRSYAVDRADRLPASVKRLIESRLPGWKFEPPVGHPDGVSGTMTLRMLARPIDDKRDRVSISGASFYDDAKDASDTSITPKTRGAPIYPNNAVRFGETATVYLLVRVGRDGHVADVFAEQVNLDAYASARKMEEFRQMFAESAIHGIKQWTFRIPTQGKNAALSYWYVRIPVRYYLGEQESPASYGEWHPYVPGPRLQAPWADAQRTAVSDAIPAGTVLQEGEMKLLSALDND